MPLIRELRQVAKPAELINTLNKLWTQDKRVEQNLRRARAGAIIAIVLWFAGLWLMAFGAAFVVLDLAVLAPAAVILGIMWFRYSRQNLDDRRILTPLKFLEVLSADISARDPVRLVVSFDDYRKHGRKLAEDAAGGKKRSKYADTWLRAEGFLADKTRFRVTVTERVSLSEKRKRKYVARKERIRELAAVQLRAAEKLDAERVKSAAAGAGQDIAGLSLKSVRATAKCIVLIAESGICFRENRPRSQERGGDALVGGDKLLTLMAAAYDRLNACRA